MPVCVCLISSFIINICSHSNDQFLTTHVFNRKKHGATHPV